LQHNEMRSFLFFWSWKEMVNCWDVLDGVGTGICQNPAFAMLTRESHQASGPHVNGRMWQGLERQTICVR
jgi:hypothetical protein